jgi:hypothetical protein
MYDKRMMTKHWQGLAMLLGLLLLLPGGSVLAQKN